MRASALPWLLLVAGSAAVAASAPVQSEQVPLDMQVDQARREAVAASAIQQRAERAASNASNEAGRLRLQRLAAANGIAAEEARISAADAEGRLLRARLAAQRQMLANARAPVSSLLAGLAMIGRRPALTMIADAGSSQELIKLKLLVQAITPAIRARTAAVSAQLDRSRALEQSVTAARTKALQSRARLDRRKFELAGLEAKALQLAEESGGQAVGAGDIQLARAEQAELLGRQSVSSRQSLAIARDLARLGPAPQRPGSAPPPPRPLLVYRLPAAPITEGLGNVSDNGVRSRGLTLATRRGTPVAAPASGTILFSGPFRDYDGIVIIDHGGGWRSVLVNLGSGSTKGARVTIGQPLGIALGPLEVQLRRAGRPVSAALIAGSSAILSKDAKSD